MQYNRLIMFCDYGLDDAIATLHILKHAHMFNSIYIVPIGGNVSVDVAYKNAHTLLAHAKADKSKVRIVDTRYIEQCAADIPDIHGNDGIGDVLSPATSDLQVISLAALKSDIERYRISDAEKDCVLSLGPATIPCLLGYMPYTMILMGGTVNEPPNYGDYEFNEGCDTQAFDMIACDATGVATLDTCHDKRFGFETFAMNDPLADSLIDKYREMCIARNAPVAVYDYVAALAVTNPELFDVVHVKRPDGVEFNELRIKN